MTIELALYIFTASLLAFIVKGLAGFGDPLISVPLLSMRLDNSVITPGMAPLPLFFNSYIVIKNRRKFCFRTVSSILIWMLLGIIPGVMLLKIGSPWVLKAVLGLFIAGLGVEMLTRDRSRQIPPNAVIKALICFLSGVTAGLFNINLLFIAYLERVSKDRSSFRANTCFIFLVENVFRLMLYAVEGMFTTLPLQIMLAALPGAVCGMFLGGFIDRRMGDKNIQKIIIYVFILGGISTFLRAFLTR